MDDPYIFNVPRWVMLYSLKSGEDNWVKTDSFYVSPDDDERKPNLWMAAFVQKVLVPAQTVVTTTPPVKSSNYSRQWYGSYTYHEMITVGDGIPVGWDYKLTVTADSIIFYGTGYQLPEFTHMLRAQENNNQLKLFNPEDEAGGAIAEPEVTLEKRGNQYFIKGSLIGDGPPDFRKVVKQ